MQRAVFLVVIIAVLASSALGAGIRPKAVKLRNPFLELVARQKLLNGTNVFVGETGNANDYMDQVVALVHQMILDAGLDNVKLPDGELSFSIPVWPLGDVYGGVYLHDGFMRGMETFHREGDATLTFEGTTVYFESDCAINNGALGYALTISFMDIGPTASAAGTLSFANFYFKAAVDLTTGTITIQTFDIKQIGSINMDITGLGIFNWLAELIVDLAVNLIKGIIKELIEGPIRTIVQRALEAILASMHPTTAAMAILSL